jgi:GMP synthase (glutamine-hydrolysing)
MPTDAPLDALVLRHAACEGAGAIGEALRARGLALREVLLHEGAPVPADLAGVAALVVMGGPMSVYEQERHPHLRGELALVERALREQVPVLGVCLGSQLLAAALGARVAPGAPEIGWLAVTLRDGHADDPLFAGVRSPFRALSWHGDVFDLPRGAAPLARTAQTEHQAFRWGASAWGLLFHLEADAAQARAMSAAFPDELARARVDADALARASDAHAAEARAVGEIVFGRFADLAVTASRR